MKRNNNYYGDKDMVRVLAKSFPRHKEENRIHDVKLLGHDMLVKLNFKRLKAYSARINKHVSYIQKLDTQSDIWTELGPHFNTRQADINFFENYNNMLRFLKENYEHEKA